MPGAGRRTTAEILDDADDFHEYLQRPQPIAQRKPVPNHDEFSDTVYGVPKLALVIITGNFALWALGLIAYWIGRLPVTYIIMGTVLLIVGFCIWLAIAYIQWRFFWWLLALAASLSTLGLGYFLILLLTGVATLSSIRFPPYF